MRILVISPFLPWPLDAGGKTRLFNLNKISGEHEEIFFLGLDESRISDPEKDKLLSDCRQKLEKIRFSYFSLRIKKFEKIITTLAELLGINCLAFLGTKKRLAKIVQEIKPDIIQCEFTQTSRYLPRFSEKTILVVHEIVSTMVKRKIKTLYSLPSVLANYLRYRLFIKIEKRSRKIFDSFIVMSLDDKRTLMAQGVEEEKIRIIKNGVDIKTFSALRQDPPQNCLYYIGWFDNEQNADALRYFFHELLPRYSELAAKPSLKIIGRGLPADLIALASGQGYEYFPFLEEKKLIEKISGCVLIVPLRFGGGTRLKILEAMSLNNPVISTPIGAEGIDYEDQNNILIFKDETEFSHKLKKLLEDKAFRQKIADGGRRLVEEKYDWSLIAQDQIKLYDELMNKR